MDGGIQAIGEIGRSRSKTGRAKRSTFLYHAIKIPRGVLMTTPNARPTMAIWREEMICCGRVAPSGAVLLIFSIKVSAKVTGPGKVDSLVIFRTSQPPDQQKGDDQKDRQIPIV